MTVRRKRTGRKRDNAEARLQRAVVQLLMLRGVPGLIYFAVPNGMVSDPITVRNMKAQGLMPGAPDLVVIVPPNSGFDRRPLVFGLELKTAKGRLSVEQELFQDRCIDANFGYWVARGIDEAVGILELLGAIKPDRNQSIRKAA